MGWIAFGAEVVTKLQKHLVESDLMLVVARVSS